MHHILISSPDPESLRMLELAFELSGWRVETALRLDRLPPSDQTTPRIVLLDLVTMEDFRPSLITQRHAREKTIVIAPHGIGEAEARKRFAGAHLVLLRPYELIGLTRDAQELAHELMQTRVTTPHRHHPKQKPVRTSPPARKQKARPARIRKGKKKKVVKKALKKVVKKKKKVQRAPSRRAGKRSSLKR